MRSHRRDTRTTRRNLTAACVVAAPVVVGFVRTVTPIVNPAGGEEVVQAFGDHMTAARVSIMASVLAAILLPFFVLGLYRLSNRGAPVVAGVGAALAIAGWAMLPILTASDVIAYEVARTGGDTSIWDHFTDNAAIAVSIAIFIGAHEVGMVLLGIALWWARAVPGWAAGMIVLGVAAHLLGVVTGVRATDVAGFAALVMGSAVAARAIVATHPDQWDLPPVAAASSVETART